MKKYLMEGMLEPKYPRRMSPSKLDAFAERLTAWLEAEQSKGRTQRRSLKHLHRDLVRLGFGGSYDRVCAFARAWRQHERERHEGRLFDVNYFGRRVASSRNVINAVK